jgi:hypothetical protein
MIRFDVFGREYNDAEPAFVDAGPKFVYDRLGHRYLDRSGLLAYGAAKTPPHIFVTEEIGTATAAYKLANNWDDENVAYSPPIATPAPITTVASGGGGTFIVTVGGGPADKAYSVTIKMQVSGNPPATETIPVAKGDTADKVATQIAAALHALPGINSSAAGKVVTSVSDDPATHSITTLTAAIA